MIFSVLFLNSYNIFSGGTKQQHIVCKSQVGEAVWNRVEQQVRQRVTLLGSFSDLDNVTLFVSLYMLLISVKLFQEADVIVFDLLQEADAIMFDVATFECLPN